jgi:kinesin family protein 2/24
MAMAHSSRTTHATVANDTSSRSHAICQVFLSIIEGFHSKGKLRYREVSFG